MVSVPWVSMRSTTRGCRSRPAEVVGGVVLQFAPGGEAEEFGMGGAAAFFEVAGGQARARRLSPPDEPDAVPGGQQVHGLSHGADVVRRQRRVGAGDGAEFGGLGLEYGEADGGVGDVQPAVGFLGQVEPSGRTGTG